MTKRQSLLMTVVLTAIFVGLIYISVTEQNRRDEINKGKEHLTKSQGTAVLEINEKLNG